MMTNTDVQDLTSYRVYYVVANGRILDGPFSHKDDACDSIDTMCFKPDDLCVIASSIIGMKV